MKKPYSLCISKQKIQEIKKKEIITVSHLCSPRWEHVLKKNLLFIRFYDNLFCEDVIVKVTSIQKIKSQNETIIKISCIHENA